MSAPAQLVDDVAALCELGHDAAIIEESPRFFVVITDLELPSFYVLTTTDLMMMADYQYPMSALDMFWTAPKVTCAGTGAVPQNADLVEQHIGREWQRWSWHYTWNPACHNVITHLEVFFDRLAKAA